MANPIRLVMEVGPKGKRVIAVAPDWPGLERGAKTEEAAIERLRAYLPRYQPVVTLAGMGAAFAPTGSFEVVERYPGSSSTDFWGISFAFSAIDQQPLTAEALERELALMQASWSFFDDVRSRVSAEMRAGPRGGGRDRERIVRHVLFAQQDWAKKIGVAAPLDVLMTDQGLTAHRNAYCDAIRQFHAQGKLAGKVAKWPLRYLIRHTAYHTLDHAWEMEDNDLGGAGA